MNPIPRLLIIFSLIIFSFASSAQTLFTYGKNAVSKDEFLRAYNKNSSDSNGTKISYDEYLQLYSKFKIKVQAALDAQMDTTAEQRAELESFRYQLAENFLKEDASIKLLTDEAFERSLKDIHLSHISIPFSQDTTQEEIAATEKKIAAIYEKLNKGETFEKAGADYDHGDLGWVTTFVLPYQIENVVYATAPGKYSAPFRSSKGFHIIKNNEERKASGKMRVAQILLAYPPDTTANTKQALAKKADSIYNALKTGAEFSQFAAAFSSDNLSYQKGGELPAFGPGQYDPVFEKAAFALAKDGDITPPFETKFGYHILSRLQHIPVVENKGDEKWADALKERVMTSDRMEVAQAMLVKNIREAIKNDASAEDIKSDSAVLNYYRNHLEKYNADFADQLNEFKQGNLLFSIMQKKVWDPAGSDSIGLQHYYNQHKDKYYWENSADALIVTFSNPLTAEAAQSLVKNNINNWKKWAEESNGSIQADSGRFELGQIPVVERTNFTEGLVTAPVINEQDSSRTLAYILKLYTTAREPKKFQDATGSVINDYQIYLEENWINELKKKYPVRIKRKVFKQLGVPQ